MTCRGLLGCLCVSLALTLCRPATAQDAAALFDQANAHYHGNGVTQDYARAAELYRRAGEMGHHEAQTWHGYMLAHGRGLPHDPVAAFGWLERGAQGGGAISLFQLAVAHYKGWGVAPDLGQACQFFERAGEAGHALGAFQTGKCFQEGTGRAVDAEQALKWFLRGGELGNVSAMNQAGWAYQNGLGTAQDFEEAVSWYERAAATGDNIGQNNMGFMHYRGLGVPQDYTIALAWFHESAAQGNIYAMYNLGEMHEHGAGVPKDPRVAYSWYQQAESGGHAGVAPKVEALRIVLEDFEPLPPPVEPDTTPRRAADCGPHGVTRWDGNREYCDCDGMYWELNGYCVEPIESIPMDDVGPIPNTTSTFGQD